MRFESPVARARSIGWSCTALSLLCSVFKTLALLLFFLSLAPKKVHATPSVPETLDEYERCKFSHRCNRAFAHYNVTLAEHTFTSAAYFEGNRDAASVFTDFETWYVGTHGWNIKGNDGKNVTTSRRAHHFDSFDYPMLTFPSPEDLRTLVFNTSSLTVDFNLANGTTGQLVGVLDVSSQNTQVAIFNFDKLDIQENVTVIVDGSRAFVLMSRSTIYF